MTEKVTFNINAELYQNNQDDLAIKLAGEYVYEGVGLEDDADFADEAAAAILKNDMPSSWHEMPAHELLYGKDWQCIASFGFINGDEGKPAVEMEVGNGELGKRAQSYLRRALH